MSLADRVRKALQELGEATAREVADYLEVQTRAQVKQVNNALHDLLKGEEVKVEERMGGFTYLWLRKKAKVRGEKQEKLWRAMQVKAARGETFTAKDLAVLAETHLDYAKRYLRFCVKQGLVALYTTKGNTAYYQIGEGQKRAAAPAWNRRVEEKKAKMVDPCRGCQVRVKTILDEMKTMLIAISGEADDLHGIIDEIQAGLPFTRPLESKNGDSADQPSQP
jgi:hypothetical protein